MSGLFQGLENSERASMPHQLVLNAIDHEPAHVNTPGYTRQGSIQSSMRSPETADYNAATIQLDRQIASALAPVGHGDRITIDYGAISIMAEMVRQQHVYDAAARVITYIDDALDTLINAMGVVGREVQIKPVSPRRVTC